MIIIFFAVNILLFVLGVVYYKKFLCEPNDNIEDVDGNKFFAIFWWCLGILLLICNTIAVCCLLTANVNNSKKQNHIDMLVEENANIQQAVDVMVKNYCQHEGEVYTEIIGDNVMYVMTLYPKLTSSELVSKQIDLYVENNKEIKRLKSELVYSGTIRFWLYFGN